MTEPHTAVITRLSADFAAISHQLARVSTDLTELDRILSDRPESAPSPQPAPPPQQVAPPQPAAPPQPVYAPQPVRPPAMPYWPQYAPPPAAPFRPWPNAAAPKPKKERSEGWIGKLLAVAGVAVTLIGVVLLLVLAAQAGILRPEFLSLIHI